MKNPMPTGKRRGLLPMLLCVFVITVFIINCSGKKTGKSAEAKTEPRQKNEEIASNINSGETDNITLDADLARMAMIKLYMNSPVVFDRDNLWKSENLGVGVYGGGDYEDEIFVYYTENDKEIKIIESLDGKLMYSIKMTCYFFNENDCRIEFSFYGFSEYLEENGYEEEDGNIYYIVNGVLYRDRNGTSEWQYDVFKVIDRINYIKNEFNTKYR